MEIVAALFIEDLEFRQVEGPSTRIDIKGAYFSTVVDPFPTTFTPHLVVLLRAEDDDSRNGTLEVTFVRDDGEEMGRSRQPVFINPPGKFFRQLVRPELELTGPCSIEARCVVPETESHVTVPLTILP
ncbi:MAG: hypothetical protein JWL83_2599 [Actinomycetia bacterium]|nr:hypothetical protein [Actinomycetes bacterium]